MGVVKFYWGKSFTQITVSILLTLSQFSYAQIPVHEMDLVFQTAEMQNVKVITDEYKDNFVIDLYYPTNFDNANKYPAIIFIKGYADTVYTNKYNRPKEKDWKYSTDWARLVATNNIIGINYETLSPSSDLFDLFKFININNEKLSIDKERIGIWANSGGVITAMEAIRGLNKYNIECAAFYSGFMIDEKMKYFQEMENHSEYFGFQFTQSDTIRPLNSDIPLFLVMAGQEEIQFVNESMIEVVKEAIAKNVSLTFINYKCGHHAFYIINDNDESRRIIHKTLNFYNEYLSKIQTKQ